MPTTCTLPPGEELGLGQGGRGGRRRDWGGEKGGLSLGSGLGGSEPEPRRTPLAAGGQQGRLQPPPPPKPPPQNKTALNREPAQPRRAATSAGWRGQQRAGGCGSRGGCGPGRRMQGEGWGDAEPGRALCPPLSRYLQRPARGGPAARPSRSGGSALPPPPRAGLGEEAAAGGARTRLAAGRRGDGCALSASPPALPPRGLTPGRAGGALLRPGGASPRGSTRGRRRERLRGSAGL